MILYLSVTKLRTTHSITDLEMTLLVYQTMLPRYTLSVHECLHYYFGKVGNERKSVCLELLKRNIYFATEHIMINLFFYYCLIFVDI